MLPFRTILCPLDFSGPSDKALSAAIEVARHFEAELVLVHVIPEIVSGIPVDPTYAFSDSVEFERAAKVNVEEQLSVAAIRIPTELRYPEGGRQR